MTGKALVVLLLACMLAAGGGMYYLQVYHFYSQAPQQEAVDLIAQSGETLRVPVANFEAIDASSSPIRYRACFTLDAEGAALPSFQTYEGAVPRTAPYWFDCFDADAIGAAIGDGTAAVFAGQINREFGIDRVVALFDDGRGFVWHEVNDCGDKAYDGTPLGDDCPPRP